MLNKFILNKDHYETETLLEFKNCQIVQVNEDNDYVFIKVNDTILNKFSDIKKEIIKIINKNSELYCDSKKIIHVKETFEEVIKVKQNENKIELNDNINYDITILLYGIWFGKNSYGPMIKIIDAKNLTCTFLKEESDSDDEIHSAVENFCST